jgi:hypothetical protein
MPAFDSAVGKSGGRYDGISGRNAPHLIPGIARCVCVRHDDVTCKSTSIHFGISPKRQDAEFFNGSLLDRGAPGSFVWCRSAGRSNPDHNPRNDVAKGFLPNDIRPRNRVAVRLYKINDNHAVDRPEHAGRDLHHP